jgi:hypothetical protein
MPSRSEPSDRSARHDVRLVTRKEFGELLLSRRHLQRTWDSEGSRDGLLDSETGTLFVVDTRSGVDLEAQSA